MRKADNLQPSCAVVTKFGNLNFLGPSGPVQTCNGTALPLTYLLFSGVVKPSRLKLNGSVVCSVRTGNLGEP